MPSDLVWRVMDNYFRVLNRIGLNQLIRINCESKQFEYGLNKFWLVINYINQILSFVVFIFITLVLFAWNHFTKDIQFLVEQVIFMAFFLFCINHSFTAFCATVTNGQDFISGLNDLIKISALIQG